mgnify:CR=1 FL=1
MLSRGKERQSNGCQCFADQEDYFHIIDIIARVYGTLPSEIAKLDWFDLMLCLKCIKHRGARMNRLLKRYKKSGVQPTVSLTDLIDILS